MEYYDIAVLINELCNYNITAENLRKGIKNNTNSDIPAAFFEFICGGIDDGLLELLIENKYGFSPVDNAFLKSKMIEYLVNKQYFSIQHAYDVVKILSHLSEMHYLNMVNQKAGITNENAVPVVKEEKIFKDTDEDEHNSRNRNNTYREQMGYYVYNSYF